MPLRSLSMGAAGGGGDGGTLEVGAAVWVTSRGVV